MKFNVQFSKGFYHTFTTNIKIEADTKEEAQAKANKLIENKIPQWDFNDELVWKDLGSADSTLYQVEEIEKE